MITPINSEKFLWRGSLSDLASIPRTILRLDFPGIPHTENLLFVGSEDPLRIEASRCDLIFLSATKAAGENSEKWQSSSGFTNMMLIQWMGDFAERIAIGRFQALLNMEKHDEDLSKWLGVPINEVYWIGSLHLPRNCHWKTIRLV